MEKKIKDKIEQLLTKELLKQNIILYYSASVTNIASHKIFITKI